jgi:hypothetical protein
MWYSHPLKHIRTRFYQELCSFNRNSVVCAWSIYLAKDFSTAETVISDTSASQYYSYTTPTIFPTNQIQIQTSLCPFHIGMAASVVYTFHVYMIRLSMKKET